MHLHPHPSPTATVPPTTTRLPLRRLATVATTVVLLALPGTAVARPAQHVPARIVSLSPTATEDLFAIGAGPQVVAVDDQSDFPKAAPTSKLSGITPNIEAIARLHPDLVVAQYDPGKLASGLRKLHVRLLLQPSATSLDDAYGQIRQLGAVTGHVDAATSVVTRMQRRLARIVASVPHRRHRRTIFHELSPDLYSATSKTFAGKVYSLLGLRNVADAADSTGSGYPQLSSEYVVAASPAIIVLADHGCCGQTPRTVRTRPGWSGIDAVRHHRVIVVDDDIASRWGPRVVDFAQGVANAINAQDA